MKQCKACYRFLAQESSRCQYCGVTSHITLSNPFKGNSGNYHFDIPALTINGKRYSLNQLIDRGGYGTVLHVSDEAGTAYALKVSLAFDQYFTNNAGFSVSEIQQSSHYLYAEIKALSQLQDDLKLRIDYAGPIAIWKNQEEISFPGILMELAEFNLGHIIHAESIKKITVPFEEKIKIISDILQSLIGIHHAHLLHRDLSPDNIFAISRAGEVRYIISDFGSAKFGIDTTAAMKMSSRIAAHDYYIDPERRYNSSFRYDVRSDIWSVGVIICEILIGNFWPNIIDKKDSLNIARLNFETDVFERYIKLLLERKLYKILRRAVKRDPAARYAHVDYLHNYLSHYFKQMSFQALQSQSAQNAIRLSISIEATLPLNLENIDLRVYTYNGSHKIEWDSFHNWRIIFPYLRIENAQIAGTKLFTPQVEHNTVELQFNRHYFIKRYQAYVAMLNAAKGCLLFTFQLTVQYSEQTG